VGAFGIVESQCAHQGLQHRVGDTTQVAALEAGVVVHADPGQRGDLFTAQTWHAAFVAEDRKPCLGRADPGSPAGKEVLHVLALIHTCDARRSLLAVKGTASTRLSGSFRAALGRARLWFFVVALDAQVINVALPDTHAGLGLGLAGLQ
jgi:hypothetical protein